MEQKREDLELELLVVRCQLGERPALTELVERWHPRLAGFVNGMLTDTSATDDVVQEVWMAVFRGLPRLRDTDRFVSWLFTIARRSVNDRLRSVYRRAREVSSQDEDGPGEIEDPLVGIPDQLLIRSALSELAPIDREVTWLAHFEDRTVADIAAITDVPVGTVKSRLHRSRRQLRSILESKGFQS